MKRIIVIALLCAIVAGAAFARGSSDSGAADFPSRPVTATVAWPAGTAADLVFRAIGEVFPKYANGQPLVVENRPDAAGGVSGIVHFMQNARPDGYSMLQWNIAHVIKSHWDEVPFTGTQFEAVANVMTSFNYLCVAGDSRWQTLQEFLAEARANPGQISVGNAGVGGGNHMGSVLLEQAAGVQFRHVPFQGGNLSINGLLTGDCQGSTNIPPEGIANAQSGQIRILAIFGDRRFADIPDVPTGREAGVDLILSQWRGFVVPRGTPPEIVNRLSDIIRQCVEDPIFIERMESMVAAPAFIGARDFAELIESENARIEQTIRSAGLGNRYR